MLEDLYKPPTSSIVLYDRRRVGKIELLRKFIMDKKHLLFCLMGRIDTYQQNVEKLQDRLIYTECKMSSRSITTHGDNIKWLLHVLNT